MAESYINFSEPDTDKAISTRILKTISVDTAATASTNVRGHLRIAPNEATFQDNWLSLYPAFS